MAKPRVAEPRNDEVKNGRPAAGAWREQLGDYAAALWTHSAAGGPAPLPPRLPVLGEMAEEAVSMVETFTLGALARAKRGGNAAPAAPPEEFRLQLGLILNGLERSVQDGPEPVGEGPPLIFPSRSPFAGGQDDPRQLLFNGPGCETGPVRPKIDDPTITSSTTHT